MEDNLFLQPVNENDGDLYYCHWQSVFAALQQLVDEMHELEISNDIEVFNMDDFADIHELPMKDFMILRHFRFEVDEGSVNVSFNLGISTYSDGNNHRLSELISYVYGRVFPGKAMYVVNKDGLKTATLTFTENTLVNQMSKSEMRSTQFITVTALSTATSSLYRD